MLSFIERRPSLPVGLESMEGYPPVTKALHIDASTEVYQLAQEDKQTTLLVLSRHADSSVLPAWWGQLTALEVPVLATQTNCHGFLSASIVRIPGERALSMIGDITEEAQALVILLATLDVAAQSLAAGVRIDLRPSLLWITEQHGKITLLPLLVEPLQQGGEGRMISDIGRCIYTIATGRNAFALAHDESVPPFRQWFSCNRALSALIMRCISNEQEGAQYNTISEVQEALQQVIIASNKPQGIHFEDERKEMSRGGMAKVAGMHALKALLEREVIAPLRDPEPYQRYGLTIPSGILLYGPPGCGKTYIARQLADELGFYFVEVIPSEVASTYIHGTSKMIRDLFDTAAEHAPAIIFIDEFEALVPKRSALGGHQQYKSEEVNEFLAQLNDCTARKIFVIAATNEPEHIDPAIRRSGRIDKLIPVGPPDAEARQEMLRMHLANRPVHTDIDFEKIVASLEGYSASDLKMLVDEAARDALAQNAEITEQSLTDACQRVPPSVNAELLRKYEVFGSRGI